MRADRLLALLLVSQAAAQAGTECTAASAADALAPQSTPQRTHTDAQRHLPLPYVKPDAPTSQHPLVLGASPGTTGTMSLYYALKALRLTTVHYTRQFNASTNEETTTYDEFPPGGPVPLIRPLFKRTHPAPPVDIRGARELDLRFLEACRAHHNTHTHTHTHTRGFSPLSCLDTPLMFRHPSHV